MAFFKVGKQTATTKTKGNKMTHPREIKNLLEIIQEVPAVFSKNTQAWAQKITTKDYVPEFEIKRANDIVTELAERYCTDADMPDIGELLMMKCYTDMPSKIQATRDLLTAKHLNKKINE